MKLLEKLHKSDTEKGELQVNANLIKDQIIDMQNK
jgi:hypothetical protein